MTKAVFITKVMPVYDDLPEQRYHFPKTYLKQAQAAVGDFILYYEPRRVSADLSSSGGKQAYFATAKLEEIVPDPSLPDHYYGYVSNFLEFDRPVPFKEGGFYYEAALRREDGKTSKGAFGRAVRNLPDAEFNNILAAGFANVEKAISVDAEAQSVEGFSEPPAEFERPIIEKITRRPFRDRAFSVAIKSAYNDTCAFTGLKIIYGGGRSEVQAAHIKPVAARGPDSVRNGLALSGTVHWMFDRGLLSIAEDMTILTAVGKVPDAVGRLLSSDRRIILPDRSDARPHPEFLAFHRSNIFKG